MNPIVAARTLVLGFLVVLTNGVVQGDYSIKGFFDLKRSHDLLEHTVEVLKAENEALETEIYRIENSKDYAKRVLRDKFHYMKEGEELIFFDD